MHIQSHCTEADCRKGKGRWRNRFAVALLHKEHRKDEQNGQENP